MILHLIAIDFHDCCPSTVSASKISHVTINWCGPSINFKLHQLANGIWPMIIIQFEKFMFYCFQRLSFRLWNIPFPFTNYDLIVESNAGACTGGDNFGKNNRVFKPSFSLFSWKGSRSYGEVYFLWFGDSEFYACVRKMSSVGRHPLILEKFLIQGQMILVLNGVFRFSFQVNILCLPYLATWYGFTGLNWFCLFFRPRYL